MATVIIATSILLPAALTATVITRRIVLATTATTVVIAGFGFAGRNARQAQGADARCHERCCRQAGNFTPGQ